MIICLSYGKTNALTHGKQIAPACLFVQVLVTSRTFTWQTRQVNVRIVVDVQPDEWTYHGVGSIGAWLCHDRGSSVGLLRRWPGAAAERRLEMMILGVNFRRL